jgi:hypothetical protein
LILEMAHGPDVLMRSRAYDLFGEMLAPQRDKALRTPLTPQSEATARKVLLDGLRDRDIVCRRDAVCAVVKSRELEALPIFAGSLRPIPTTDATASRGSRSGASPRRWWRRSRRSRLPAFDDARWNAVMGQDPTRVGEPKEFHAEPGLRIVPWC